MHTHFKQTENKLALNTSTGMYFINPEEIVRLEASSNYTNIYFSNKKKLIAAKVLKEFVQILEPYGFLRTHRTHLINKQHIHCVTSGGNIIMKDESIAEISRRMKSGVMRVLKKAA
jgi:two-component system LytT family response regulator